MLIYCEKDKLRYREEMEKSPAIKGDRYTLSVNIVLFYTVIGELNACNELCVVACWLQSEFWSHRFR